MIQQISGVQTSVDLSLNQMETPAQRLRIIDKKFDLKAIIYLR